MRPLLQDEIKSESWAALTVFVLRQRECLSSAQLVYEGAAKPGDKISTGLCKLKPRKEMNFYSRQIRWSVFSERWESHQLTGKLGYTS